MSKEQSPPAFPQDDFAFERGITIRDYFAAKAMQALISKEYKDDIKRGLAGVPIISQYAYEYADSMIEEREK